MIMRHLGQITREDHIVKIAVAIALLSALVLGMFLRIENLFSVGRRSPDERTYAFYGGVIADQGPKALPILAKRYNAAPEAWLYPPPTRAGYLLPLAQVMKLTGQKGAESGGIISCAFSIASLFILLSLGLRFFNPAITFYAALFAAVSPYDLGIARRAWTDSLIGCLALALVYCCCQITVNPRRKAPYYLFVATGTYGFLVKELMLFIYGICMLWVMYILCVKERGFIKAFVLGAGAAIFACGAFLILIYISGGVGPYMEMFKNMATASAIHGYGHLAQSGPWYSYLLGFWIMSPISVILFTFGVLFTAVSGIGVFKTLRLGDVDKRVIFGMIFFIVSLGAIFIVIPDMQNFRWACPVFIPFYMISGLGLWYLAKMVNAALKGAGRYAAYACMAAFLVIGPVMDYKMFDRIFIKADILDLSIRFIMEGSSFPYDKNNR